MHADPILDAFWRRGLILLGDRVRQEYGLNTPIFIDLRHGLYDGADQTAGNSWNPRYPARWIASVPAFQSRRQPAVPPAPRRFEPAPVRPSATGQS